MSSLSLHGPIKSHTHFSEPKAYAEHLMTQSRSSFTLGMKALPKARREAMFAIYAFCRAVDDIADEPGEKTEKLALLQDWRREIDTLFDGAPQSLVGRALVEPIERFALPKNEFILMIEGMETDVNGPVCAPNLADLLSYTRRVAGTVGILSIRIFGVEDVEARDRFALNLADAFQLTNILRDVEEDAEEHRLYLPRELLCEAGIHDQTPLKVAGDPRLVEVGSALGKIARARFNEARRALKELKRGPVRPALMMMGVYEGYLDLMEKHGFVRDPLLYKMAKFEKLKRGLSYAFWFPERTIAAMPESAIPLANVDQKI